jgi:hypothetical protein
MSAALAMTPSTTTRIPALMRIRSDRENLTIKRFLRVG